MVDPFLRSLHVRPFEGVAITVGLDEAVSTLGLEQVRHRVEGFEAALTAALWHDSYLHEHRSKAPALTPGVLRALETLGGMWVSREFAIMLARGRHDEKPGSITRTVAQAKLRFAQHVADSEAWVVTCGKYSASLAADPTASVRNRVFHQVAGILCLSGEEVALRGYLAATLAGLLIDEPDAEWMALLQKASAAVGAPVEWTFDASGPDHMRVFTATCTAGTHRRVSASASSKKAARLAAAELMIREHFPRAAPQPSSNTTPPRPPLFVPRGDNTAFSGTVAKIASAFDLPVEATPLVAQAFLHSSWTYENQREVIRARQRDHGVLGYIGSHILNFEASLAETHQVVREAPEDYAHRTPERQTHVDAMRLLLLDRAVLLGRGQQSMGMPEEISSTVFQAVAAAVYLESDSPRSLFERWPDGPEWDASRALIAPEAGRDTDATTRVQEFVATCGLVVDYDFEDAGPDHRREYTAKLALESPITRRRLNVTGAGQPSKTAAKHAASSIVVGWIDALADPSELERIARLSEGAARAGTTFLLAHLCEVASERPTTTVLWRRRGLLGSGFAGHDLEQWATAADVLLRQQQRVQPDVDQLTVYFRQGTESSSNGLPLSEALASILEWVVALDPHAPLDEFELRKLVNLAGAYRALGEGQDPVALEDIVQGQVLLSRGLLRPEVESLSGALPALTGAAFESLLAVMLTGRQPVQLRPEPGWVVLEPHGAVGPIASQLASTTALWQELGVSLQYDDTTGVVMLEVSPDESLEAGPLTTAVRRACSREPSPLAAAVANLLHDLKNQLAAAQALAATPDNGSRTSRLERELAASRHLDQAAALAERIRAASSLLRPTDAEVTPLASFLRHYASAMLVRLPASISLSVSSGPDNLAVAMSESALTAVLDNLIKNAVEAMTDGGRVALDWTNDDNVAIVEVADDGPGLPDSVRSALATGGRVASTKPGGNGLGLLGVRSLLRRVGGDFELAQSATGTAWHLTVPIAETAGS